MRKISAWAKFLAAAKNALTKYEAIPNSVKLGLAGVTITFICTAGFSAVSLPWLGGVDSLAHLDYTYQISNGQIPEPYGYKYKAVAHLASDKYLTKRHIASAHPPLFYSVYATIAGDMLQRGNWAEAMAVGRLLNIFLGVATILTIAYAGWLVGGKRKELVAVATPAVSILIIPYIKVVSDIYNEPLAVLLSALTMTLCVLLIKRGPQTKYLILIALACALGMLTKATFVAMLAIALASVAASFYFANMNFKEKLVKSVICIVSILVLVALTSGWFYFRNYSLSGSWFRATPKHEVISREYQSLGDNLKKIEFYNVLPGGLLGIKPFEGVFEYNRTLSVIISLTAGVALGYSLYKNKSHVRKLDIKKMFIVAIMALQILAIYAMQLQHATGWGRINPRYFLPGLLPIGLFFAYSLLPINKRQKHMDNAIPSLMFIFCMGAILHSVWFLGTRERFGLNSSNNWVNLMTSTNNNGFPEIFLFILAMGMGMGIILTAISLKSNNKYINRYE